MILRYPTLLLLVCLPVPTLASDVPSADAAVSLGRMTLGLVVVIALVFALAWAARRLSVMRARGGASGGPIEVVGQLALGTRERLLLVEVDGRRVLLGVVPGRITRLDAAEAPAQPGEAFSSRLTAAQRGAAQRDAAQRSRT